ncbi:hypothetical protein VCRA2119O147_2100003 [Vibrio crassostreae]|uniref:Uncharacterized protein n=1 Tax=Vibrio crassostreae TaxID=246167 RepID=A0ABM9QL50_9VIBR|nr:hypothetical protein VCRA2118O144_110151 [Vibrio crassostreae]CAK1777286.1 hypothetical protein VCRA2112O185_140126 [Vibrio crassostreae]CAK1944712.1 hypothetical protein VCRA2115O371_260025 [Vibrio crassostreae]CAK1955782.1 hypothetical protein VCRA2112O187_270024 [Vibrio crassostreae]CAK1962727.1 hypothetical protein VCRA2114O369_270025 [Vibrio crassostreae]
MSLSLIDMVMLLIQRKLPLAEKLSGSQDERRSLKALQWQGLWRSSD